MPTLDLRRYFGVDHPSLLDNPEDFRTIRTLFAEEVIRYSRQCSTGKELIDALILASPPESGFTLPRFMGNGSNRDVFLLSFGMVLKIERPWTSTDQKNAERAGQYPFWYENRRTSHYNELVFACAFPRTFVEVFGASIAFGHEVKHPAVLITERSAPLDTLLDYTGKDDDFIIEGIDNEHLFIDDESGELKLFDPRFDARFRKRRWTRTGRPMTEVNNHGGQALSIRNIGLCQDRKVRLIDAGGIVSPVALSTETFLPVHHPWIPCQDGSPEHVQQGFAFSDDLMATYRHIAALARQKGGTIHGKEEDGSKSTGQSDSVNGWGSVVVQPDVLST